MKVACVLLRFNSESFQTSSMEFTKVSFVNNLRLIPNWYLVKTPGLSKRLIMRLWSNFSKALPKTGRDIGL